jgi:hypothetical protein
LLKLSVKMNVLVVSDSVSSIASSSAYSTFSFNIFIYPGNLAAICTCSGPLKTLEQAMIMLRLGGFIPNYKSMST